MIPYVEFHRIPLGPLHIQVWGLFVALGMGAAVWLGAREAAARALSRERFIDLAWWLLLGALIGARLGHVIFYSPSTFLADPAAVLRVWEGGMSMFGGIIGGVIGAWWYARTAGMAFLPYAQAAAFALPCGYGIGRIGCFLIHDHPGTLRGDGLLTVAYPDGPRYDHGLLLSLFGFLLFGAFLLMRRHDAASAARWYLPVGMISYGVVRFLLDFDRARDLFGADARYLGLTPAQYGGVALIMVGVAVMAHQRMIAGGKIMQEDSGEGRVLGFDLPSGNSAHGRK